MGSAAEPEEIDLVAWVPDVGEELIAVLHLLEEAFSHRAAEEVLEGGAVGADAGVVVLELAGLVGDELVQLAHVGVVGLGCGAVYWIL